ncbi:glycine betaine ABC transporter substrate-binding protein [Paucilactobacillus nenjiangensis]|jgi:osmoprotectant transport system substrate-binding protein|uniref:osmoprotectant ABC transporter substrate-binding protein n=1 Tax=Paucilactobacillus nenjiangensis TaxID=1296540 RepID=UPI003BB6DBF2
MKKRRLAIITVLGTLMLLLSGCGFPGLNSSSDDTIRIAAINTTEQQILASIDQQMIEHYTDLKVTVISNLGSSNVTLEAMKNGDADMSAARYDGTDLTTILGKTSSGDPAKDSATVKKAFQKKYHFTYLPTYGFADTYAWMVTQKTAQKYNLNTVSDMKNNASQLSVGLDQTWMKRSGDGYPAFQKKYGFAFGKALPMQIGLVYDAVSAGKMDAVLGYSTDGRISSYNLKILKDDQHFFPPYYAYPVATNKVLKEHPELIKVLSKLSGKISVSTMQKLNYKADDELQEPSVVARNFLKAHNYFEGGSN